MSKIKQIAVTGGKGGVGKSTISVLLAKHLSNKEKVILVDVDVECPNDYLLMGKKLENEVDQVTACYPHLIKSKCRKCGLCAQKCRFNAILAPVGEYPRFFKSLCANCGVCWNVCPYGAIEPKEEAIGSIYENKINNNLTLITGVAKKGVDETGPIVRETRKFAEKRAKDLSVEKIVVDTAPGTHCGVINALLDVDTAIAVTEPTPLGEHDLDLIKEIFEKLSLDYRVIVNRSDVGDLDLIKKVVKKDKIIAQIPHSRKIISAYLKGQLLSVNSQRIEQCLKKL